MNLLTPKKVHTLKNVVPDNDLYTAEEFKKQTKSLVQKPIIRVPLLHKIAIFWSWGSSLVTILLAAAIIYIALTGYPRVLRNIELSFLEDRVDEISKSVASVEDKVDVQQTVIDKLKKAKAEKTEKVEKIEKVENK